MKRPDTTMTRALRVLQWRETWPYAVVAVVPFVLLAPFLFFGRVFYWGAPLLQFYPWRSLALEAVRAGQWPLWNPYLGNGAPLLANYQTAVFYPPNWLSLVMPLEQSLSWLAAAHLAWAGIGMVTLARSLGLRPFGQAVAGLSFSLAQYLVSRIGFFSIMSAAPWLPWLLWAVERQISSALANSGFAGQLRAALLVALITSMLLLAGHAQTAWYILLLTAAWAAWRLVALRQWPARMLLCAAALVGAMLLAVLLSAIQLLPTAELLRESHRAEGADYDFVMTYSYSPWRLLTLAAPDLLGNPARGRFIGYGNYWEDAAYIGIVPLLLAMSVVISAFVALVRRKWPPTAPAHWRPLTYWLISVLVVGFLLALGRNTPLFPFLYANVPTFELFQAPTRWMIWPVFALALMAGMGADRWAPPAGRSLYWTRLGTAGALAALVMGAGAAAALADSSELGHQLGLVARAVVVSGLTLAVAGLLSSMRTRLRPAVWVAAMTGLIALDLLWAGYGLNPAGPRDLYRRDTEIAARLSAPLGTHRIFQFADDEYDVKFGEFLSFHEFGPPELAYATRESLLPNAALLEGISSANNYEPLLVARFSGLMNLINETRSASLLRMADVAIVASQAALDWPLGAQGDVVRYYALPGEARRTWVVYQAHVVPSADDALARLADADFDPAQAVILEADWQPTPVADHSLTRSSNAITIQVSLDAAGWVVVADTFYPGWVAWLDGQPAPIVPANYALRAVAAPAGQHTVVFDYQPQSFLLGQRITAVAALAWAAAFLAAWLARGRNVGRPPGGV